MINLIPRFEFALQSIFRSQKNCPHCQSTNAAVLVKKHGCIRIRRCAECGLVFTDPIYKPLLFSNLYDSLYQADGSTTHTPNARSLEGQDFKDTDKDSQPQIAAIGRLVRGRNLLEIGSSWGYFLHQAIAGGFERAGVELGDSRRNFGSKHFGLPMYKNCAELAGKYFDVVYTSHTLEHFTDLSSIFSDILALLKPGGALVATVPNFDFEQFGVGCLSVIGAVHPVGFSSAWFSKNLPKKGFEDVRIYERWEAVGGPPVERSEKGLIVYIARRPA